MKEIETDRMVDRVEQVPSIQKGHEGDAVKVEVESCPASNGSKESSIAMQAGNSEVHTGLDDPADFSQWELCFEENLEQDYADDYEDVDECGYYELHGRYNLNEYGPVSELFMPGWPVDATNLFGLLLRLAEESFYELNDFNNRRIDDIRPDPWDETKYRIWLAMLKLGLTPFVADRLISHAINYAHCSYWDFYDRSGKSKLADNFYEAETDRYMYGKNVLNMRCINNFDLPSYAGHAHKRGRRGIVDTSEGSYGRTDFASQRDAGETSRATSETRAPYNDNMAERG